MAARKEIGNPRLFTCFKIIAEYIWDVIPERCVGYRSAVGTQYGITIVNLPITQYRFHPGFMIDQHKIPAAIRIKPMHQPAVLRRYFQKPEQLNIASVVSDSCLIACFQIHQKEIARSAFIDNISQRTVLKSFDRVTRASAVREPSFESVIYVK